MSLVRTVRIFKDTQGFVAGDGGPSEEPLAGGDAGVTPPRRP